jgi:aminoglycoside phosphotransferase (APT) family kinase protein
MSGPVSEDEILQRLRQALVGEVPAGSLDDLVVIGTGPSRRRSSLYFVGLAGSDTCRWVVKRPTSESQQNDLTSPLSAPEQYHALERLHEHLHHLGDDLATPRPVALLPEIDAYVMEYVPGPTVTDLMGARAVIQPDRFLDSVAQAGRLLQAVHALEPARPDLVDLTELRELTASRAPQVLRAAGLPVRKEWFRAAGGSSTSTGSEVLLHGDYAPENVVLSPDAVVCLEPDLAQRGWPEHDVVRFLLMLADAPLFVVGTEVPAVRRLRHRASARFLESYYGGTNRPESLRPLMLMSAAARWSTRHTDVTRRNPRLGRTRQRLLQRHFSRLLDEVSAPDTSLLFV